MAQPQRSRRSSQPGIVARRCTYQERTSEIPVVTKIRSFYKANKIDWLGEGCYILNKDDMWKIKQESQSFKDALVILESRVNFTNEVNND